MKPSELAFIKSKLPLSQAVLNRNPRQELEREALEFRDNFVPLDYASNIKNNSINSIPKKHKYGAVRTVVDGITFSSKAEAKRYGELKALEEKGEIKFLTLQPSYKLEVNGHLICKYVADFRYVTKDLLPVIEDTKGFKTPVYNLKKKLMRAIHGIEIYETK